MWGTRNRQCLPIEIIEWDVDERTFWRLKRIIRRLVQRKGKHRAVWSFRVGCWGGVVYPDALRMLLNAEEWKDDGVIY